MTLSSTACEPIKGEVLRFSRWHTAGGILALPTAVFLGGGGIYLIAVAAGLSSGDLWFLCPLGVLGLLEAGGLVAGGWYLLTHKPCLVLGQERLQFSLGKHISWQVRYSDIAAIALLIPVHPLGYRMVWTSSLGIRLTNTEPFDGAYPRFARSRARYRRRCGFDLGIPMMYSFEPPERCLEAVLRCYHLFKADQQAVR
jgi:hypothetical protein